MVETRNPPPAGSSPVLVSLLGGEESWPLLLEKGHNRHSLTCSWQRKLSRRHQTCQRHGAAFRMCVKFSQKGGNEQMNNQQPSASRNTKTAGRGWTFYLHLTPTARVLTEEDTCMGRRTRKTRYQRSIQANVATSGETELSSPSLAPNTVIPPTSAYSSESHHLPGDPQAMRQPVDEARNEAVARASRVHYVRRLHRPRTGRHVPCGCTTVLYMGHR